MGTYDISAIITREAFANFLDRYAERKVDDGEWDHFVIRHYHDIFLEEIRRCLVRLVIGKSSFHEAAEVTNQRLHAWALLLRMSTNASMDHTPDIVTIDITPAEAVVFDSILRRYSTSGEFVIENQAERQCLWNIECLLEKDGSRPVWPSHKDAVRELNREEN